MTRAQQTISFGLLVTSLYLSLYLQLVPLPEVVQTEIVPVVRGILLLSNSAPCFDQRILADFEHYPIEAQSHVSNGTKKIAARLTHISNQQLPFWALVSFGAYLLFRLGWNVMTFHDVPEAHKELTAEIELAKADLRRLGVDVD
ncbi:dolichol-phosphate mannosyltransferase subunit 3 [Rostrohypoxylon terebratum]|nr:dolichol-phosphate mannosyltransferase subunit 3 [Rostrohypoxylon terebratum]